MKSIVFLLIIIGSAAGADVKQWLLEFHSHPYEMMNRLAPEVTEQGLMVERGPIDIAELGIGFEEHAALRDRIAERSGDGFRPETSYTDKDDVRNLVDNAAVINNLAEIDRRGLAQAQLILSPWADSYWPTQKGLIAIRYADPGFPNSKDWMTNYSYFLSHPARSVLVSGNQQAINNLSPAEKYDLLVGDPAMTLSNYAWGTGKKYYEEAGFVAHWMGICHGWAAAASMLSPVQDAPITLRSPEGINITFYQSDIKALNSMLWANASPPTRFVGARCKVINPIKNAIGRIEDPECWDNNPATFYLGLVNQLGLNGRSFVMDSTFDLEVWNFPILSYRTTYFNPQTLAPAIDFNQALLPIEKYTMDKFKPYRTPGIRYVAGIVLDVTHINAVTPTHGALEKAPLKTIRYIFDLELDARQNIIGGEWYMNAHPDFLWTFPSNAEAKTHADLKLDPMEWDVSDAVPSHWRAAALAASAQGSPLYSVVKRIAIAGSRGGIRRPQP